MTKKYKNFGILTSYQQGVKRHCDNENDCKMV